ncbi:MAG: response regulator [Propionibacteriaceae bacterium]|nr:response regulator [Propionibacteriaceae bacterium]
MLHQPRQRPATILIVDDEPVQLRAIVAELNAVGFDTLIARDGADGLAKALRGNPDLILLDILLAEMADPPGLSELARRVGTNHSKLGREFQSHLGMSTFEYLRST